MDRPSFCVSSACTLSRSTPHSTQQAPCGVSALSRSRPSNPYLSGSLIGSKRPTRSAADGSDELLGVIHLNVQLHESGARGGREGELYQLARLMSSQTAVQAEHRLKPLEPIPSSFHHHKNPILSRRRNPSPRFLMMKPTDLHRRPHSFPCRALPVLRRASPPIVLFLLQK
jgi:hypothetical protein